MSYLKQCKENLTNSLINDIEYIYYLNIEDKNENFAANFKNFTKFLKYL